MPRHSLKAQYEHLLEKHAIFNEEKAKRLTECFQKMSLLNDDDDDDDDNFYANAANFLKAQLLKKFPVRRRLENVQKRRYLFKRRHNRIKIVSSERRMEFLEAITDDDFKEEVRMTKASFNKLIDMIKGHPLYQLKDGRPQKDIRLQVTIVLERLGTNGNGASQSRLARRCGVSVGSIRDYTLRFFKVMMSFEQTFIYWPTDAEKQDIIAANQERFGFPDLLGFIDGSTIDLDCAPTWNRRDEFYGRKSVYCINTQAICDHNRKIRYFATGWAGNSHDMKVLKGSDLYKNTSDYFSGKEYVLGDGGYKAYKFLVPIRKKPRGEYMPLDDEKFNTFISMMRIKIEHAFGILKARFYSLKSLPIRIRRRSDMQFVNMWITVCIILNNFLLEQTDDDVTIQLKHKWDRKEAKRKARLERTLSRSFTRVNTSNDSSDSDSDDTDDDSDDDFDDDSDDDSDHDDSDADGDNFDEDDIEQFSSDDDDDGTDEPMDYTRYNAAKDKCGKRKYQRVKEVVLIHNGKEDLLIQANN